MWEQPSGRLDRRACLSFCSITVLFLNDHHCDGSGVGNLHPFAGSADHSIAKRGLNDLVEAKPGSWRGLGGPQSDHAK